MGRWFGALIVAALLVALLYLASTYSWA